jgi:hypothetical protein
LLSCLHNFCDLAPSSAGQDHRCRVGGIAADATDGSSGMGGGSGEGRGRDSQACTRNEADLRLQELRWLCNSVVATHKGIETIGKLFRSAGGRLEVLIKYTNLCLDIRCPDGDSNWG